MILAVIQIGTRTTGSNVPSNAISATRRMELEEQAYIAVKAGNMGRLADAIRMGASANARFNDGETLLQAAVVSHNRAVSSTRLLLSAGAKIESTDSWGGTALMSAASAGNLECVRMLMARGADPNRKGIDGETFLAFAVRSASRKTALWLIQHGASMSAVDNSGNTVLHLAAYEGRPAMCRLLVHLGASLKAKNQDGQTAGEVARHQHHSRTYKLLKVLGINRALSAPRGFR